MLCLLHKVHQVAGPLQDTEISGRCQPRTLHLGTHEDVSIYINTTLIPILPK